LACKPRQHLSFSHFSAHSLLQLGDIIFGPPGWTSVHHDWILADLLLSVVVGSKLVVTWPATAHNYAVHFTSPTAQEYLAASFWFHFEQCEGRQVVFLHAGQSAVIPAGALHFVLSPTSAAGVGWPFQDVSRAPLYLDSLLGYIEARKTTGLKALMHDDEGTRSFTLLSLCDEGTVALLEDLTRRLVKLGAPSICHSMEVAIEDFAAWIKSP
jgi:hypothetical protein